MANGLRDSFKKADSRNLPKVDIFMVYGFITKDDRFNAAEVRDAKSMKVSRESYGDSAVGYVCLKREGEVCIVQAQICPEHKVHQKQYTVVLYINEREITITNIQCIGCSAALGGCKHAFAFLMWINRRSEEPACTEVSCYWKKSKLSAVGTKQKFILASEMAGECSYEPISLDNSSFINEVTSLLSEKQVDSQLSRYKIKLINKESYSLSLYQIFLLFSKKEEKTADGFIEFAKQHLNKKLCQAAEKETRAQTEILLWYELRYARITAFKLHETSKCKTKGGSLVNQLIGAAKLYQSKSMARGKKLEDEVFEVIKEKGYKIEKSGFILIASHPIFGASPDAVGADFIVEMKCPTSDKTLKNYLCEGKITEKYKTQIMLQMFAANKKKGLFCVADSEIEKNKKVNTLWVQFEKTFLDIVLEDSTKFWKENIYPIFLK